MDQELTFRIILESPPPGVDYGLQKGSGNDHEVTQKQRSAAGDLRFDFAARVKEGKDGQLVLLGPFVQDLLRAVWGPSYGRESNYLRVYANQLRRKLEPDPANPRHLVTEPGLGYRFNP